MKARHGILLTLGGAVVGGALGILFAPQTGRRTRSMVRDKAVKYSHDVVDYTGKKSKHIANKTRGYVHDVKGRFGNKPLSEEAEGVVEEVAHS